jgi:hypothetical protein
VQNWSVSAEVAVLWVFTVVYIRRIAGLCFVSQYGTEVDWISEFEVVVYYIHVVACLV